MSHLTSKFRSTPTFSFKFKNETISSSNRPQMLPSPHHYQVDRNDLSRLNRGTKFSKELKGLRIPMNKANPGPGSYQFDSSIKMESFNKNQGFKKGQNRFRLTQEVTPSSAHYSINQAYRRSSPQFSIGKNSQSLRQINGIRNSPAPNIYSPNQKSQQHTIAIGFGTAKRKVNIHPQNNPGPASFSFERQSMASSLKHKKSFFSKARRGNSLTSLDSLPGPGFYARESTFSQNLRKQRGFSLKSRSQIKLSMIPGPGFYQNTSQTFKFKKATATSIPKTQRALFINQYKRAASVPGPGHNQTSFLEKSKFNASLSSKFQKAKLPHFIESTQKKRDFINPQKLDVNKTSTPRFSIPSGRRKQIFEQQLKKTSPSLLYNPNEKMTKPSEITHKISKTQRMKKEEKGSVGPGSYNAQVADFSTKKSKFMKQKRKTFLDDVINNKLKTFKQHNFQNRQQFPNPPKYMNVYKKLQINESKIKQF